MTESRSHKITANRIAKKRITKKYNKSISGDLIGDIRSLIETARHNLAVTVNAGLTILYWQIGSRIRQDILKKKWAKYGKEIIATLSRQLTDDYGNNFNEKNLRRMIQFAEIFPDKEIVVSLIRQLSWTHFIALIPLKDDLQRDFYAEMCRVARWPLAGRTWDDMPALTHKSSDSHCERT